MSRGIKHILACFSLIISLSASGQTSLYEELQTAYLYNFAKYVTWPSERETFVIGVFGNPENLEFLQTNLESKKMKGKSIDVVALPDVMAVENHSVNMIYVPEGETKNFSVLLKAVAGKSILIVTGDDMVRKGAMISFVMEEDKLRFKLKKNMLESVGLKASEGLLKLAIVL